MQLMKFIFFFTTHITNHNQLSS